MSVRRDTYDGQGHLIGSQAGSDDATVDGSPADLGAVARAKASGLPAPAPRAKSPLVKTPPSAMTGEPKRDDYGPGVVNDLKYQSDLRVYKRKMLDGIQ